MELSYPSAQINKSVASAIPPLGQVPHLSVAANRISYSCGSARQLASLQDKYRFYNARFIVITSRDRNSVFYLLSAHDTDQQVTFMYRLKVDANDNLRDSLSLFFTCGA